MQNEIPQVSKEDLMVNIEHGRPLGGGGADRQCHSEYKLGHTNPDIFVQKFDARRLSKTSRPKIPQVPKLLVRIYKAVGIDSRKSHTHALFEPISKRWITLRFAGRFKWRELQGD